MNAHEMIKTLRDEGCAVVWFEPSELNGADPRKLEDSLSEFGYAVIETLSEHLQQENKEIVKSGACPRASACNS